MLLQKIKRAVGRLLEPNQKIRTQRYLAPFPIKMSNTENNKIVEIRRPVIFVGTARTGTTMVMDMLSGHPDLVPTTGEPEREDVVMWTELGGAIMSAIGKRNYLGPVGYFYCLPMDETDISDERIRFFHRETLRRYPQLGNGKKRLLNANAHLSNKLLYVKRIFPDASIIFLVRNPYAIVASMKNKIKNRSNFMFEVPSSISSCFNIYPKYEWNSLPQYISKTNSSVYNPEDVESIRLLARYWKNIVLYIMEQSKKLDKDSFMVVRYEDIVSDHEKSISKILKHCDLAPFNNWAVSPNPEINKGRLKELNSKECAIVRDELGDIIKDFEYEHLLH